MIYRRVSIAALALACLTCISVPARAEVSIGGGGFVSGGEGSSGLGLIVGTGAAVPVVPIQVGLTGFVPIAGGGGYAATFDGRFSAGDNSFGAGIGFGEFGGAPTSGALTLFFDHRIAPQTAIELRGYQTSGDDSATAAFLGLRFSL